MHKAIAILIAGTLSGCAVSGPPHGTPVSPAEVFAGPYLEVKSPNSQGWYLMPSSPSGMTFGREGPSKIESFIAGVNMFALPATNTPVEFEELIRTGIQKDTPSERYEMQRQALRYTEERGYPCVRIESLARDKNPRASNTPQLLALDGLYCRHPKQPEAGFSAIYSFRGASEYPGLHTEAQSFTEGVQVPEK